MNTQYGDERAVGADRVRALDRGRGDAYCPDHIGAVGKLEELLSFIA